LGSSQNNKTHDLVGYFEERLNISTGLHLSHHFVSEYSGIGSMSELWSVF